MVTAIVIAMVHTKRKNAIVGNDSVLSFLFFTDQQ